MSEKWRTITIEDMLKELGVNLEDNIFGRTLKSDKRKYEPTYYPAPIKDMGDLVKGKDGVYRPKEEIKLNIDSSLTFEW